jgi:hypothetical protein
MFFSLEVFRATLLTKESDPWDSFEMLMTNVGNMSIEGI